MTEELTPVPHWFLSADITRFDLMVADMARAGFTLKTISAKTGFSIYQVSYRLKQLGLSTAAYRRGESDLAQKVIAFIDENSARYFDTLVSNIRRYIKDQPASGTQAQPQKSE